MVTESDNLMEKIVSLAKRRGFIFPGSEIYGGLSGTWDYGPLGVELKNNIKQLWWKRFVHKRDDIVGIDSAIIMNPKVWEVSGHVETFSDPLVECKKCHERFRFDTSFEKELPQEIINHVVVHLVRDGRVGSGLSIFDLTEEQFTEVQEQITEAKKFNLLFRTFVGPVEDSASQTYLCPETAQGMFVNFKNVLDTTRRTLPFGIAQIGKAFRNEITPRDFIFRSREFEQMEIEYFVRETEWSDYFNHWLDEMRKWIKDMGIDTEYVHELEVPDGERAHYSKRTVDFEYDFPFGRKELYGLACRGAFDLRNHFKEPPYREEGSEPFYPYVVEPSWGVDRTVLAILLSAYREEKNEKGTRIYLALKPRLAPYKAAVFPLVANKPQLV
ncbi:MAG: glycine--tRNA ligase, partial [Patescibacteria group bacterium]